MLVQQTKVAGSDLSGGHSIRRAHNHKGGRSSHKSEHHAPYPGYHFVDKSQFSQDDPDKKLVPWVPRPVEEVCKTYSHIYRLLTDPHMRKIQTGPQRRLLHVSVPRLPGSQPPSTPGGGQPCAGGGAAPDELSENDSDAYDSQASLAGLGQPAPRKGPWGTKSSPGLLTGLSGASTTAATLRPGSRPGTGGSTPPGDGAEDLGRAGGTLRLPPLSVTASPAARLRIQVPSIAATGIDAGSRPGTG